MCITIIICRRNCQQQQEAISCALTNQITKVHVSEYGILMGITAAVIIQLTWCAFFCQTATESTHQPPPSCPGSWMFLYYISVFYQLVVKHVARYDELCTGR